MILTLSGADVRARSVGIDSKTFKGTLPIFLLWDISFEIEIEPQCARLRWGENMATPMFIGASQNTMLVKPLWF